MVLFDTLEEECSVKTEFEHFFEAGNIVVEEGESADGALDALRRVLVGWLCTQVVNFDHVTVVLLQKANDVTPAVAVKCFCALCGEATGNDAIGNVGHIQVELSRLESVFVRGDKGANEVHVAAAVLHR